ncbi:MAG: hypothetical protein M3018_05645 [Actinomycetota bacterium]|nr:hypothetical protein [Actinomycetota bacterium]
MRTPRDVRGQRLRCAKSVASVSPELTGSGIRAGSVPGCSAGAVAENRRDHLTRAERGSEKF